jgi:hypothetical protein
MRLTLNQDDPVELALSRFCSRYITKLTTPEAVSLHRLVLGEAGRFPEVGQIFYERVPLLTKTLVSEFIASAMDRGALRRDNPMRAAQNLFALAGFTLLQRRFTGVVAPLTPAEVAAETANAVDMFMRAYRPEGDT